MAEPTEVQGPTAEEIATSKEVSNSAKTTLADLCAKGSSLYTHKQYTEAADHFAQAAELQAELNGDLNPENAEILFLYGRSLFKVGQSNSDVLGGRAGGEEKKKKQNSSTKPKPAKDDAAATDKVAEEGVAAVAQSKTEEVKPEPSAQKPLFQFTGDENFEDSDEEEEEAAGEEDEEEDEEEEEDDLAASFELLDLARVCFERKLAAPEESEDKGKSVGDSLITKHIKERLSDTHDLLAEISLENERFPQAVEDFKSSLVYKEQLHPKESEIIAEAHFKLSLALEFASITTTQDSEDAENTTGTVKETQVDEDMREEAAKQLELAIESTKLKLQNKEVDLASTYIPEDNDTTIKQIAEVREIIADMEQRLLDLRAPPVDVNAALGGPAGAPDSTNPMSGILGAALGESPAEQHARIEEAKKGANDLTGLVRRKKAPKAEDDTSANGKRKAEDNAEKVDVKKAKVEEVLDAET